jgi:cellulose synthase/poly-beta-1,6-N-acetylglucosamine synthase-like glycosyltransferase
MSDPAPAPPRLTVVIPTLGRDTLLPTIHSVLRATGADQLEISVVGRIADPQIAGQLAACQREHEHVLHHDVTFAKGDSSEKKNVGWRAARADIVAFLDDDVVVAPDWPVQMLAAFNDPAVALVSGPGLIPPDAGLFARLAGLTLSSPAAGYVAWRYRHGTNNLLPIKWSKIIGCNMAYRKSVLTEIDGFDPAFWPGEEMIASFRTQQKGYQLIFHSAAWAYHYPRQTLGRFWRQIFGYGATRIRLIRAGVECEPTTLVPVLLVLLLVLGLTGSLFSPLLAYATALFVSTYLLAALGIAILMTRESGQIKDLLIFFLIPILHLSYGIAGWVELIRPNRDLGLR